MSESMTVNLTPTVIEFNHSNPFPTGGAAALHAAVRAAYAAPASGPDAVLMRYLTELEYLIALELASVSEINDDDSRDRYLAIIRERKEEISDWISDNPPKTIETFKHLGRLVCRDCGLFADYEFVDAGSYLDSKLTNALLRTLAS